MSTKGALEWEVVVTRPIGVRVFARKLDRPHDDLLQSLRPIVRVVRKRMRVGERKREALLLVHRAGKIDRAVVPKLAVEAAEGFAERVLVDQLDDARQRAERFKAVPVTVAGRGLRKALGG